MPCAQCGTAAAPVDGRCPECGAAAGQPEATRFGTPVAAGPGTLVAPGASSPGMPTLLGDARDAATIPPSRPTSGAAEQPAAQTNPLQEGQEFGSRYHIIRLLGTGGMGSVYQAWDKELEVAVAIKVIRPEAVADQTAAKEIEKRFKRELLLARQVTHRNVVRIHDFGEVDGIKYITMPYVQGSDLASLLAREGRMAVPRALSIARQVASGLVAAHEANVVHRDLKPANIMIDADDHALIMDFGIARSTAGETGFTMTAAGAVIGTLAYMAPEQAKGEVVDQRADVYAFGLILRDMLLGSRYGGSHDGVRGADVPDEGLAGADAGARRHHPGAARCARDAVPAAGTGGPLSDQRRPARGPRARGRGRARRAGFTAGHRRARRDQAGAPAGGWSGRSRRPRFCSWWLPPAYGAWRWYSASRRRPAREGRPGLRCRLAVLPFRNASGDPALDSLGTSLSEVLATDLGETAQIRAIPSVRLREVLRDLRIDPNASLSPADLARIADFASAKTILWGQYVKFGEEIRIDATLQDLAQQKTTPLKATAANQAGLLAAVGQLAGSVQQALAAGSSDVLNELKASAWRPSTQSFEALRLYNDGLNLSRDGNHQEAAKRFEAAVAEDANFALAYSALAETYGTLGYDAKAQQQSRRALDLSQSLQPQERYLIAAAHYGITNDNTKAVESYENLLEGVPEQREDPVRSGQALRAHGRPGQGAGALRKGRRARPEVR